MKYSVDKRDSYTIFEVGEDKLNSVVAPELKTELVLLTNEGTRNIILNLENVSFVDSSGLSAILVGNRACQGGDGILVITNINENVKRLITISQLDGVLTIIPTLQESKDYVMMQELERELTSGDSETTE